MLGSSMRRVGLIDITVGNATRLGASQRSAKRRCASHHIATQRLSRWGSPAARAFSADGLPSSAPVAPRRSCEAKYMRAELWRTFQSTRTRRRREQYIPLVAFCLLHFWRTSSSVCASLISDRHTYLCNRRGVVKTSQTIAGARMTISMSMVPEKTIEECKRHVDECAALLERTSVPEYREAIIAMAKAWMKIAEQAKIKASR